MLLQQQQQQQQRVHHHSLRSKLNPPPADGSGPKLVDGDYTYVTARKTLQVHSRTLNNAKLPTEVLLSQTMPAMRPVSATSVNMAAWKAYGSPSARGVPRPPPQASPAHANATSTQLFGGVASKPPRVQNLGGGFRVQRPYSAPSERPEPGRSAGMAPPRNQHGAQAWPSAVPAYGAPPKKALSATGGRTTGHNAASAAGSSPQRPWSRQPQHAGMQEAWSQPQPVAATTPDGELRFSQTLPTDPVGKYIWEQQSRQAMAAATKAAALRPRSGRPESASKPGGPGALSGPSRERFQTAKLSVLQQLGADYRPPTVTGFAAPDLADSTLPGPGDPRWAYTRLGRGKIAKLQQALKMADPLRERPTSAPSFMPGHRAAGYAAIAAGQAGQEQQQYAEGGMPYEGMPAGEGYMQQVEQQLQPSGAYEDYGQGAELANAAEALAGFAQQGSRVFVAEQEGLYAGSRPVSVTGAGSSPRLPGSRPVSARPMSASRPASGASTVPSVRGVSAGREHGASRAPVDLRTYLEEEVGTGQDGADTEMVDVGDQPLREGSAGARGHGAEEGEPQAAYGGELEPQQDAGGYAGADGEELPGSVPVQAEQLAAALEAALGQRGRGGDRDEAAEEEEAGGQEQDGYYEQQQEQPAEGAGEGDYGGTEQGDGYGGDGAAYGEAEADPGQGVALEYDPDDGGAGMPPQQQPDNDLGFATARSHRSGTEEGGNDALMQLHGMPKRSSHMGDRYAGLQPNGARQDDSYSQEASGEAGGSASNAAAEGYAEDYGDEDAAAGIAADDEQPGRQPGVGEGDEGAAEDGDGGEDAWDEVGRGSGDGQQLQWQGSGSGRMRPMSARPTSGRPTSARPASARPLPMGSRNASGRSRSNSGRLSDSQLGYQADGGGAPGLYDIHEAGEAEHEEEADGQGEGAGMAGDDYAAGSVAGGMNDDAGGGGGAMAGVEVGEGQGQGQGYFAEAQELEQGYDPELEEQQQQEQGYDPELEEQQQQEQGYDQELEERQQQEQEFAYGEDDGAAEMPQDEGF